MTGRDSRLRENQELFRTGNEQIEDVARLGSADSRKIPFLCECAAESCFGRVELTFAEYESVRSAADQFLILPAHPTIEGERVIEDNGRFHVVRKEES